MKNKNGQYILAIVALIALAVMMFLGFQRYGQAIENRGKKDQVEAVSKSGDKQKEKTDKNNQDNGGETSSIDWPLYKVTKGDSTVYVLGTIHAGNKEMYPFPDKIQDAISSSKYLVTEVDLESIKDSETAHLMIDAATLEGGKTINDYLSDESEQYLEKLSEQYDTPVEMIQKFQPWFIISYFQILDLDESGLASEYAVDDNVYEYAKKEKLKFKHLEEAADQINAFVETFPLESADEIIQAIPEMEEARKATEELYDIYVSGSIDKLVEEEIPDAMLKDRNLKWVPQIEEYFESGDTHFIAVGAAHLVGENGILTILQDKGYSVEKQ